MARLSTTSRRAYSPACVATQTDIDTPDGGRKAMIKKHVSEDVDDAGIAQFEQHIEQHEAGLKKSSERRKSRSRQWTIRLSRNPTVCPQQRQTMLEMARGLTSRAAATSFPLSNVAKASEKTDFATLPAYKEMRRQRAVADVMGVANPYFKVHQAKSGATCIIDGTTYDNFISYDYLGLNGASELMLLQ